MGEHDSVTISRKTYRSLLVGIVIVLMFSSFTAGFILGGSGTAATGSAVRSTGTTQTPTTGGSGGDGGAVSLDDDPRMGSADAPVQVVEFSDFQCPFCRRFYTQTLGQIESEYVNSGKVLFVYRDFPLDSIHPSARPSALAAECADEQGKFWEYHDKLFDEQNKQGQGTVDYGTAELKQWATEIGLDANAFNSCLDSAKYDDEVSKDFNDGVAAGVSGTPTFFICKGASDCQRIVGAQPYSVIKSAIDAALA